MTVSVGCIRNRLLLLGRVWWEIESHTCSQSGYRVPPTGEKMGVGSIYRDRPATIVLRKAIIERYVTPAS